MKKTSGAPGVVSYAGLDKAKLIAQAEAAFCRRDGGVPARFATLLPLFPAELVQDMSYIGVDAAHPGRATAEGFALSLSDYHRRMYQQEPSLYTGDNLRRCVDREGRFTGRGVVTLDREWAQRFPQYQQFMGEKLMLHVIGGGAQAVAVPESVHPRGGGLLEKQEKEMGVTAAARLYAQYAIARVRQGERYDGPAFAADYVQAAGLSALTLTQAELGRLLQEIGICRSVEKGEEAQLYTENSRRVEGVRQYVRMLAACDVFEPATVSKSTARLAQLYFDGDDYISDLWLPYGELLGYADRERAAVSAAALCEGCQIAPRYDAATLGGRYPDRLRVVTVVDRDLHLMVSDVLNNPAYGSGMNPLGMIAKQVSLPDSAELLRRGKLRLESCPFTVENTEVPTRIFLEQLALARLQEHKGRLIDAMVRREAALGQLPEGEGRRRAAEQLSHRVERLADRVSEEAARHMLGQMSGYDADIDYLRKRYAAWQEGGEYPLDPQRQASIECGYVLRGACERADYDALHNALPPEEEPAEEQAQSVQAEKAQEPQGAASAGDAVAEANGQPSGTAAQTKQAGISGPQDATGSAPQKPQAAQNASGGAPQKPQAAQNANNSMPQKPQAAQNASGSTPQKPQAAQNAGGGTPQKSQAAQNASGGMPQKPQAAQNANNSRPQKPQAAQNASGGMPQDNAALAPAPAKPGKARKGKANGKGQRARAEQITFDQLPEPTEQMRFDAAPALDELARRAEPPKPSLANKQGPMAALAQDQPAAPPHKPQNMQELLQQLLSK